MSDHGPTGGPQRAVVTVFDEHAGLGEVRLLDGRTVAFHATQLADGTRRIDVGAPVSVSVVAGHRGRLEARDVATA